jgi:hypothetical protein
MLGHEPIYFTLRLSIPPQMILTTGNRLLWLCTVLNDEHSVEKWSDVHLVVPVIPDKVHFVCFYLYMVRQPLVGQGLLIQQDSRSHSRHTKFERTPIDEWSARCRDLYLTPHYTHDRHPRPWWDSNPQFQQASGRRPTLSTARSLWPASVQLVSLNFV